MRPSRVLLLAALLVAPGCYTFIPSSPQEIAPGQDVRVRLTAEAASDYRDLRLANPRFLEGTFLERTTDQLRLEATVGMGSDVRGSRALIQQIDVPMAGVLEVELKELNVFRTGALIAGGGVALLAIVLSADGNGGSEDGPGGGNPEARRLPLLRFSLPVGR